MAKLKRSEVKKIDVKKSEVSKIINKHKTKHRKELPYAFVFDKQKYLIMLIGLAFIFFGFILMIGGGTNDPSEFSDELFSFRRLTLAPILVLIGFIIEIYAILKKPKTLTNNEITQAE